MNQNPPMPVGRVIEVQRAHVTVRPEERLADTSNAADHDDVLAIVSGEFHEAGEYPKVGDWVRYTIDQGDERRLRGVVRTVLPRSSFIKRYDHTNNREQIIVTNVDVLAVVMGLDGDYNESRLGRYLQLAADSGVRPLIILNKLDVLGEEELQARVTAVSTLAPTVPVITTSGLDGAGVSQILEALGDGETMVLLGSSGAGKSTLTNWILGRQLQKTNDVRTDDSRGRHTTTTRSLFVIPTNPVAYLIDTPGMRELALEESGVEQLDQSDAFTNIERIAQDCKFRNCDHEQSAGCAVLKALKTGELDSAEYHNFLKLQDESARRGKQVRRADRYRNQRTARADKQSREAYKEQLRRR